MLQILQCLALIELNKVNLTRKLQQVVQVILTLSMRDYELCKDPNNYQGHCSDDR